MPMRGFLNLGVAMVRKSVLLDTSFFLRFLNDDSPLFANTDKYFRYFIESDITMMISTISIAEYCVKGDIHELPLRNLHIIPFNLDHAKRAGEFAGVVFQNKGKLSIHQRNIIPNDTKLFAQADCVSDIAYYLSSDTESLKIYNLLQGYKKPNFEFIDLHTPWGETFATLDFEPEA